MKGHSSKFEMENYTKIKKKFITNQRVILDWWHGFVDTFSRVSFDCQRHLIRI